MCLSDSYVNILNPSVQFVDLHLVQSSEYQVESNTCVFCKELDLGISLTVKKNISPI